jgi:hypothetical protein
LNGYGRFRAEALALNPDYQPATVTTDGWDHTQAAWKRLFPGMAIILCFLHSVLDIQQRCRKTKPLWQKLTGRLWHLYKAPSKRHFAQRLRRLREWAQREVKPKTLRQRVLNLKGKSQQFQGAYDYPKAARTSNMIDRLMNYQDRLLYTMQYFHGSEEAARLHLRAMTLIWNFHPYGSRTTANDPQRCSPFKDLNGFEYHDNWLHNLLIAGSRNGYRYQLLVHSTESEGTRLKLQQFLRLPFSRQVFWLLLDCRTVPLIPAALVLLSWHWVALLIKAQSQS